MRKTQKLLTTDPPLHFKLKVYFKSVLFLCVWKDLFLLGYYRQHHQSRVNPTTSQWHPFKACVFSCNLYCCKSWNSWTSWSGQCSAFEMLWGKELQKWQKELSKLNIKFAKAWILFSNYVNTTIRKYSSRAFIWLVTPLDFVGQLKI